MKTSIQRIFVVWSWRCFGEKRRIGGVVDSSVWASNGTLIFLRGTRRRIKRFSHEGEPGNYGKAL